MEQETKFNKSGIIKSRIFALILLMLSCSLAISSYKSLSREFEGIIMHKEIHSGFIQKNYDLYINQEYKFSDKLKISNNDAIKILTANDDDCLKVGVSYFAYEDSEPGMTIKKRQGSPIITINGITYIDQGLFWVFISLLGMIISNIIYKQTLLKLPNADSIESEDLDI